MSLNHTAVWRTSSLCCFSGLKKQELSDKDAQMQQKKNVHMSFVPTAVKLMAIFFLFFQ